MNRNTEQHFAQLPRANIRRSKFTRDHALLTTLNEGDIVPIYCDEMLPADTARIDLNALIRMATPLYPVMDNCYMDFYFFFVPNRLTWEHWVNLMGQNDSTYWAEPVEYSVPQVKAPTGGWNVGTLADYFGIPTGIENLSVNALPFRAYARIWNEWFRDENLQQPVVQDTDDAETAGSNTGNNLTDAQAGGLPLKAGKFKDYFTSALPQPQKGPAVPVPLTGNARVMGFEDEARSIKTETTSSGNNFNYVSIRQSKTDPTGIVGQNDTTGQNLTYFGADLSTVTSTTINELRNAIAIQHIYERDARTGTRYKEYLLGAWGVQDGDARLQRSEYIGGFRLPINVNQVIQTSATDATSPQGNTGAYSMTTMSRNMCTYSAVEHGYILGLAVVRVDHSYQQGLRRMWSRQTRFDFYDPMLANLGEQAILNKEIFAQGSAVDNEVFGYQEAWADYRYSPSYVTSEMRSSYEKTLDAWHYADYYESLPTLSSGWIQEETANIDRTIAVSSQLSHQFICNFYFAQTWVRPMPIYSVPGLETI